MGDLRGDGGFDGGMGDGGFDGGKNRKISLLSQIFKAVSTIRGVLYFFLIS